ncbi:glycolate oxidase iron-sulfur subunit [Labrys miyagiensis]|uniref:Glycolate oxidase iron-sulfur subunit n=1 Tax=Labrys miyagiensis TaxID=346912 RepID=A0ABQ6C9X4_9HYPH|nr:glycolate oxidase subunit GlcF [Labrys miyagiensis]GLS17098.1 glycolate oxidase iron-sulfur subunit [Labrys miyagiensis]
MQTNFSLAQLADPHMKESEQILRTCVHCGFCTATCPTYVLLGDELDSPRGRIYLIKDMLEGGKPATAEVVKHVDRCLSCLSCMTTCPSGVHYMHLVDHARAHIEKTYERPASEKLLRNTLAKILPNRKAFRWATTLARLGRPFAGIAAKLPEGGRLAAMLALAPSALPAPSSATQPGSFAPKGERKGRVALLTGCAQAELAPGINEAAIRLLNRHGVEVVLPKGEGCCGALVHHMGQEASALAYAKANIDAWTAEMANGLDAILITTSGCGTTIKDYGFMLRDDPAYARKAATISAIAKDISEYLETLPPLPVTRETGQSVTYHAACSLQHGQQIKTAPKNLLKQAGFVVKEAAEAHLCCGSAGTYNMLQPEISARLRERKLGNIAATKPEIIAAGNIGCMTQLAQGTATPIVHTVELLDWATGGPRPKGL